jgi:hypothetical protein
LFNIPRRLIDLILILIHLRVSLGCLCLGAIAICVETVKPRLVWL